MTSDLSRLTWESNKRADAAVLISEIMELRLGQNTPNFKRNPLPECEVGGLGGREGEKVGGGREGGKGGGEREGRAV